MLSGNPLWTREMRRKPAVSHKLWNGPLEVRLLCYERAIASPTVVLEARVVRYEGPMRPVAIRVGLSLLSAVLLFLSVPTFGLWPLMWVALVPQIAVALDAPTHKRAFLYGWLTGHRRQRGRVLLDGRAARALRRTCRRSRRCRSWGCWSATRGWRSRSSRGASGAFHQRTRLPLVVLAPLVMVAIELGMPQIFPYYLAISQAFVPIVIQIADLTGPLGVTALMVALQRRAAATPGGARDRGVARRRAAAWRSWPR